MTLKAEMPAIAYIVARSFPDDIIGCDNQIPWRLRTDMRRFRRITEENAVIMGRKTFDSIGRPLPNRFNIVLSRELSQTDNDALRNTALSRRDLIFVNSLESALYFADFYSILNSREKVFVIGGSEVYRIFSDLFYEIHLTIVNSPDLIRQRNVEFSYFHHEFPPEDWRTLSEEEVPASDHDEYSSRFVIYRKKKGVRRRYRDLSDFFTEDRVATEFRARWAASGETLSEAENSVSEQTHFSWPKSATN